MKMVKLIGAGVSFAIAADAMGYAVKGFVSLQAWPTSSEIVEGKSWGQAPKTLEFSAIFGFDLA